MYDVNRRFPVRSLHVASADALTGLPTAQGFALLLDRQAMLARRYDREGAVIVVAGDRDDDAACRAVARALAERLRETDLVARLEGCEFAILLAEARATDARALAGELVDLVASVIGAPAAAGVACFPNGLHRPAGALMADADAALAAARGLHPRVAVFDAGVTRVGRSVDSRAERLRRAVAGGALAPRRRTVLDLRTGAPDHVVLTTRLLGAAGTNGLLGGAERFGLGRTVDRFACDRAMEEAARPGAAVVVPLAHAGAIDRRFIDWLVAMLGQRSDAAARLTVAVPESAAVADLAAVRSLAARAGEFGTRLALDDFGRLGAFGLLRALPVHQVRLDADLVHGLPGSDRDRAIVLGLVHAAEALDAVCVATGVDGQAELTAVRGFGIALGEGDFLNGDREAA